MIDLEFVQQLIRSVDESSIDTVEIERGGTRIRLSKTPDAGAAMAMGSSVPPSSGVPVTHNPPSQASSAPAPEAPSQEASDAELEEAVGEDWTEITSPMVGTFYRAPSPGADSFTEVGQRIVEGDVLCIIEAMKLMNELESEMEGTVKEVCVANGEPVEYGQVLFRVDPA